MGRTASSLYTGDRQNCARNVSHFFARTSHCTAGHTLWKHNRKSNTPQKGSYGAGTVQRRERRLQHHRHLHQNHQLPIGTLIFINVAAVEQARDEVNNFQSQFSNIILPEATTEDKAEPRVIASRYVKAETLVAKSQSSLRPVRPSTQVRRRLTALTPDPVHTKRELSVLLGAA